MPPDLHLVFDGSNDPYSVLRQQIQHSLQKAEVQKNQLRTADLRYSVINLMLSAAATVIAGGSAIMDDPILGNWRFTASIFSLCTLGAMIVAAIHKQVASPELLLESSECIAKLRDLNIETIPETYELDMVSAAYQHIRSEFARIDC